MKIGVSTGSILVIAALASLSAGPGQTAAAMQPDTSPPAAAPSLDAMLSWPLPGEVNATADGKSIVWVENREGVRNVFIAQAPDFEARRLTAYATDDGLGIGGSAFEGGAGLLISPDSRFVIFVKGSTPDAGGYVLNPSSDVKRPKQMIYRVDTTTRTVVALAEGRSPELSPDGKKISYLNGGKLFVHESTAKAGTSLPTVDVRGTITEARWSPDSRSIAMTVDRGSLSLIAVYRMASPTLQWMAPDMNRDASPVWSGDGKRIAFIRGPGLKFRESFNLERSYPFDIIVADVATGEGKRVHRSNAHAGGFAQFYLAEPLRWAADDRLLFYSEENRWMQIFSVSAEGGVPVALTPPGCEAEVSGLSPSRKTLFVTHNCGDTNGRQISSVAVIGGALKPLKIDAKLAVEPVVLNDAGDIAVKIADARQPVSLVLMTAQGMKVLTAPSARFPAARLVQPEDIEFKSNDGTVVHGQLFLPLHASTHASTQGAGAAKMPAVVYVHGGPIRQMFSSFHPFGYYSYNYAMNQYLALNGYAVLAVNYRSGIGYGQAFRTMPDQGPRGASEYSDVLGAWQALAARDDVDSKRIGIWGGSYGGLLTAQALARDSDRFAAGVDLHGVHDWRIVGEQQGGGGWGLTGEDVLKRAYDASPVADIATWRSPVLMIHGDADRSVDIAQSVDLAQRLREKGVAVEVMLLPDEEHDFLIHRTWKQVLTRTFEYLETHLGH